jgi:hypothetical protein
MSSEAADRRARGGGGGGAEKVASREIHGTLSFPAILLQNHDSEGLQGMFSGVAMRLSVLSLSDVAGGAFANGI